MKKYLFCIIYLLLFSGVSTCQTVGKAINGCDLLLMSSKNVYDEIPDEAKQNIELGIPNVVKGKYCIISRPEYVLGYDGELNAVRWVAWNLTLKSLGKSGRTQGGFVSDPVLPKGYETMSQKYYTGSGYDRGHICPSEQRTSSVESNRNTFILTNVLPQTPDLNQGVWRDMERWTLSMCKDSLKDLFIYAGGVFHSDKRVDDKIAIPDSCWKIVVVLERGQHLKDVNENTRIEAVMMPNQTGVRHDKWNRYKKTVREIENSTGMDFLSYVKKNIQDAIEKR
jgi:endonuclease G